MSYSGEAADQVVKMSLEGAEVAAKITGKGAKEIAILLFAALKDEKKTKGKTRLNNLLRTGKELKVFAVKDEELMTFCKEAKRYGILYCALKDRDARNGTTDIMVRAEDSSKVARIFERFQLSTVDMASVRSEIERSKVGRNPDLDHLKSQAGGYRSKEDIFLDALMSNPAKEEKQAKNPTSAREEPSSPSGNFSKPLKPAQAAKSEKSEKEDRPRPSVRQELKEIRAAMEGIRKSRAKTKEPMEQDMLQNINFERNER
jgi:hypothetical protein